MSKQVILSVIAGVLTAIIYAVMVWLAGYNFDTRGDLVASGFAWGVMCVGLASFIGYVIGGLK